MPIPVGGVQAAARIMSGTYPRPWIYDDLLGEAGRRLSRVPRYALLIARLPPDEFAKLSTEAYTYWRAYTYAHPSENRTDVDITGLLDDGLMVKLRNNDGPYRLGWHHAEEPSRSPKFRRSQIRLAADLLGALAFRMYCIGDGEPAFVIKGNVDGFLNEVFNDFETAGAYLDHRGKPIPGDLIDKDWCRLKAMDSHRLKHFIFSANNSEEIRWTDITTMAFFAAYWACRWATPEQMAITRQWVIDPLHRSNQAYREFWEFALEIPEEAVDGERWGKLFAPFYDGSSRDKIGPIRATEFIYHAWKRMEKWNAPALSVFLREFPAIRKGEQGLKNKQIADHIIDGFIPIDRSSMAHAPRPCSIAQPRLNRFCVTDLEYELFDPRHNERYWNAYEDRPGLRKLKEKMVESYGDSCPVSTVCWYDAWCFATWLGKVNEPWIEITLPKQAEYEPRTEQVVPCTSTNWITLVVLNRDGKPKFSWRFLPQYPHVLEWCLDWFTEPFCPVHEVRLLENAPYLIGDSVPGTFRWFGPRSRLGWGFRLAATSIEMDQVEGREGDPAVNG
jgi:hypothetical protein